MKDTHKDGLVAWWQFDEGEGGVLHDRSGNNNHGTIKGANWVEMAEGYALEFDGDDDHVDCGDGPTLDLREQISMTAWVCPSAPKMDGHAGVIGKSLKTYGMSSSAQHLCFYISNKGDKVLTSTTFGTWYHVASCFDGKSLRLYVDGYLVDERKTDTEIKPGGHFWMGRSDGQDGTKDAHFHGRIADVRVYNRALNAAEVEQFVLADVVRSARPNSWDRKIALELEDRAIYLSDMSTCTPGAALSAKSQAGHWSLIQYKTVTPQPGSGTMIGASSFVEAPDVTLPLNVSGWHAVYVGYWNPFYVYDGGAAIRLKFSDEPYFIRIEEGPPPFEPHATFIKEALFMVADLTDRDLVVGKDNGPFAKKAYVAYVKLVPLRDEEVAAEEADRNRTETRILQAAIDGGEPFGYGKHVSKEKILEVVERYRYSDVGKVIWAVCYGDMTNYPTEVGYYMADEPEVPIENVPGDNPGVVQWKVYQEARMKLEAENMIPQEVVAEHVHQMGLKFEIMLRLGIAGHLQPRNYTDENCVVGKHPELRMVMRDGTPVEYASYAFPEVRELMLSIIREAGEKFDIDGANLCFVRGTKYAMYEKPVLDDFQDEYREDARNVEQDDPRLLKVRAGYLTQFVRDARRVLDDLGEKKGRRLEMSAYVFPEAETNLIHAIDVESWMREGLLDSVISLGNPFDAELAAIAQANNCQNLCGPLAAKLTASSALSAYEAGADGIVGWDINSPQVSSAYWAVTRRIGHQAELKNLIQEEFSLRSVRLKTVGGSDVLQGLWQTAFAAG